MVSLVSWAEATEQKENCMNRLIAKITAFIRPSFNAADLLLAPGSRQALSMSKGQVLDFRLSKREFRTGSQDFSFMRFLSLNPKSKIGNPKFIL